MPWCPECGAEYRDGIAACAKCRLQLQDEPPPRSEDTAEAVRAVVVRLIGAAIKQVVEALSYGTAGWTTLRRHRALLLVPLLLALFHGSQSALMRAAVAPALGDTQQPATANQLEFSDIIEWLPIELRRRLLRPDTVLATDTFAFPVPWVSYEDTATAIEIKAHRATRPDDSLSSWQLNWPLRIGLYVFGLAMGSFILGGFYGTARKAVEQGAFTWSDFGRDGRRYWLRFLLLGALVGLLHGWPLRVYLRTGQFRGVPLAYLLWGIHAVYLLPIIAFFLALAWCAIVTEDDSVWQPLRRSVVTVGRSAAVGVCLLLLLSLVRLLLLLPIEVADSLIVMKYDRYYAYLPLFLPATILRAIASALVGTWFALTALHWYRGARAKMATKEPEADAIWEVGVEESKAEEESAPDL